MPRICAGCNQPFASNEAFDLHATGTKRPTADMPRRCRTTEEMHELGMSRAGPAHAWTTTNRNHHPKRASQR